MTATPFRSAVVPAAGLGTRFLPTTKTVPKELLPVVDTPGIELVAAEAAQAGAEQLLIVTSPGKDAVAAHFADSSELEATLAARGKDALAAKVRRAHELIAVRTVTQDEPLGLGHAIGCAREAIDPAEGCFAVLLPDDLVLPSGVLNTMSQVRAEKGGTVLCAFDIPREEISAYGVFDVGSTSFGDVADAPDVKQVRGMVEKPAAADAPSTFAAAGRYLLDVAVFDAIDRITPGAGGELQITDAIALLISEGHPVHVVVHRGGRHDLGNPGSYVRAFVDFALEHPDYGPELRTWLAARLAD
ncbi:UTP--glucose-1-phosphate uridylyltransferase [Pseudonocardia sp.]|uniref:UTP--glucose-1-phosphate uridylyltransferase n=1 Tax=Pseudonocardia sp. TaxID=60912 RepID=UPI002629FA3C|nr:UTP--glucose-1-phosphate uridylyltransferase [Pseudonocardia sp.]